jgi:hypothetical protein
MNKFLHGFASEILKLAADRRAELAGSYNVKLFGNWTDQELVALHAVLDRLPPRLVRDNSALRSIGRAPKIVNAPPHAPGHSMYKPNIQKHGKYRGSLVIFDKGVYDRRGKLDPELFGKSVLHELSHSFHIDIPETFGRPPYITEYAAHSPKEDWAESFAEFFLHPEILQRKAPAKAKAIASFLGG